MSVAGLCALVVSRVFKQSSDYCGVGWVIGVIAVLTSLSGGVVAAVMRETLPPRG